MKNPSLKTIRELWNQKDYQRVLDSVAEAEHEGLASPEMYVLKACALQLTDDGLLEEVEAALMKALDLDPACVDAHIELGWFLLNVKDDPIKAGHAFQTALALQVQANTEVILGLLKCAEEREPGQASLTERKRQLIDALVDHHKIETRMSS